jgi:SAM-dependent methyltransferase
MSDHRQALHQASYYDETVDYRRGSPHLSHWSLYDRLLAITRQCLRDLRDAGMPPKVLEIGAGHGGFTEPVLAAGCDLTAVEASQWSLSELIKRYGDNPDFHGVLDPDGSVDVGGDFSLILMASVLHHIPDYLAFLDSVTRRLAPGGALLTLQDPLWYARAGKLSHLLDRAGFYAWRLGQGDIVRGACSFARRVRGKLDESNPSDMVEYHVLREGVDEVAIAELLKPRFRTTEILRYWSNQSRITQRFGTRIGAANTFGISASVYIGTPGT